MNQKQNKKLLVAVMFVIIFLLIIAAILYLRKSNIPANNPVARISPTGMGSFISPSPIIVLPQGSRGKHFGKIALYLGDQKAGNEILISNASFEKPGYVVVYRVDSQNLPLNSIGNSELLKGNNNKVTIKLKESIKTGDRLLINLHTDNGNGRYDDTITDPTITDTNGNPLDVIISVFPANVFPTDFIY